MEGTDMSKRATPPHNPHDPPTPSMPVDAVTGAPAPGHPDHDTADVVERDEHGNALVVARPADVVTGDAQRYSLSTDAIMRHLAKYTEKDEERSEAAHADIIEQIMSASTVEEVLTPIEALSARDVVGDLIQLYGFRPNRSDFEVGSPYYLSLECVINGEKVVVNTGQKSVMAQVIRLTQLAEIAFREGKPSVFPVMITFTQAKRPNRHGSYPLRMVLP